MIERERDYDKHIKRERDYVDRKREITIREEEDWKDGNGVEGEGVL